MIATPSDGELGGGPTWADLARKQALPLGGGRRFGAAKAVPQAVSDAFRAAHGPAASAKQPPARSAETAPGNSVGWQQKNTLPEHTFAMSALV